jgi:hypothetical protein
MASSSGLTSSLETCFTGSGYTADPFLAYPLVVNMYSPNDKIVQDIRSALTSLEQSSNLDFGLASTGASTELSIHTRLQYNS